MWTPEFAYSNNLICTVGDLINELQKLDSNAIVYAIVPLTDDETNTEYWEGFNITKLKQDKNEDIQIVLEIG